MTEPFRWKNCYADVGSSRHGQIARAFLNEVVEPSLDTLDAQIEKWSKSDDPAALFYRSDTEDLSNATMMAFCLAIQSMWERQLRGYLAGCARELRPDGGLAKKAMNARWGDIDALFLELRGISLGQFDAYADLDLLQLLGNACRHGDGASARALWERRPDLWPHRYEFPFPLESVTPLIQEPRSIDDIAIPRSLVRHFVDAIASFWDEAEYIYNESIEPKHEYLEKELVEQRRRRAARRADEPPVRDAGDRSD